MGEDFTKTVRIGTLPDVGNVYCKIEFRGGKLSISGVEGPKADGDARGSAGQIVMGYAHRDPANNDRRYDTPTPADGFTFAAGWDADTWLRFVDVWETWHLNDMQAGCVHQRANWDTDAVLALYHWRLSEETSKAQRKAKRDAEEALMRGETVTFSEETRELLALPWQVTTETDKAPAGYDVPRDSLGVPHVERKAAGWVRPSEHSGGLLGKPCEVCGYAYGTAWLSQDVPDDVLEFLRGLPDADRTPAWV